MKCFLTSFFFFFFYQINAQCVVDIGEDRIICLHNYSILGDTIPLSTTITTNVLEPYQIIWSTKIVTNLISLPFLYASDLLNDTSGLTPLLYTNVYIENNIPIVFVIEVIDSIGNSCKDSISIKFSNFQISMETYEVQQHSGDTFQIQAFSLGGIPPIKYTWGPKENIDTITNSSCCPLVWPTTDVTYSATVIDSAGCSIGVNPQWNFRIITDIKNLTNNKLNVYPNPTKNIINIEYNEMTPVLFISIFNMKGQEVYKSPVFNNQINIEKIACGFYTFIIRDEKTILSYGKIRKE